MKNAQALVWTMLRLVPLAAVVASLLWGNSAAAAFGEAGASPWNEGPETRVRLIAAQNAAGNEPELRLGLHFQMNPGWKIYWRTPGEAGYPPRVDWSGSDNLAGADLEWPVPHRFSLFGLETFGYKEEVVLPLRVRAERPGEPVSLRATVDYLTCNEICIPVQAALDLAIPAGPAGSNDLAPFIADFAAKVPGGGAERGLTLEEAVLVGDLESPRLRITLASETPLIAPDALVEGPPGHGFGKPEVSLGDGGRRARLEVPTSGAGPETGVLDGKRLVVTLIDGARGLETEVLARFAPDAAAAGRLTGAAPQSVGETGWRALLAILAFAFLGGLILNLMPCVLPVLSLKLLSVVKHGGGERGEIRRGFLASAAGILVSFLVLAAGAALLKAAGVTVGWGMQFQQPVFLSAMAVIVTLFALNLFGAYEILLPAPLQDAVSAGAEAGKGGQLRSHFLTGAFATLLATPCSAPFLGTAVAFALSRGTLEIFAVFAFLGLGLAAPYILVAAVPALAQRMPKPGRWMITLRRILGLALAATAIWLLWVLAGQVGVGAALAVSALLAGLVLVVWAGHRGALRRPLLPLGAVGLALAAILLPLGLESPGRAAANAVPATDSAQDWAPLDEAAVQRLVGEGRLVFVDVTADWCLTCQVNKALVIDQDEVQTRFRDGEVVTMRGDWTLPSDEITQYLNSFGRYGIPFNAVFGPAAPGGVVLPELLTVQAVMEALDKAALGAEAQDKRAEAKEKGG